MARATPSRAFTAPVPRASRLKLYDYGVRVAHRSGHRKQSSGTPRTTVDALSRPRKFPTIVCVRSTCVSAKAGVHQNDIRQDCIPYRGVGFKTTLCERQNDREKSLEAPHRLIRLRPGEASVLRPPHQPQRVHHPSTMPHDARDTRRRPRGAPHSVLPTAPAARR